MQDTDWTDPVVGSVSDWKAANPDATECNLSYRADIVADDIKLLAGIQKLSIRGCSQLGDDAIQHLKGIKILDMVNLDKITDAAFPSLVGIKSLRMSKCSLVTDEAIKHLAGIEVLVLRICENITGSTFRYIESVQKLDCAWCPKITDEAFIELENLKDLTISGCKKITDEAFSNFEGLKELSIASCNQRGITDAAFQNLVNIRVLNVGGCDQETLTDSAFGGLDKLTDLFIDDCPQFTDEALKPIKQLKFLSISGCDASICGPNLQRLKDAGTHVEDDGLCEPHRVLPPGRNTLDDAVQVQKLQTVKVSSFHEDSIAQFLRVPVPSVISDIVHGDTDFQTFVIRNFGGGLVLKIKDKYVGISRVYLSDEMKAGSSTFYECIQEFTSAFEFRDIYDTPYFAIKTPYGSLYVLYEQVIGMLEYDHSFWEVIETDQVLEFTASRRGVLAGGPIESADHCQTGTTKKVYDIEPFVFEVEEEEEEVPTTLGLKFGETRVEVDYSPTQTLGELRGIIQTKFDLSPDKQRLLYNGRELADDTKMLKDLNVQAGFTVAVMKRGGRKTFRRRRCSKRRALR